MYQIIIKTLAGATVQTIPYRSQWAATYIAMRYASCGSAEIVYVMDTETGEIVYDFARA